MTNHAYRGYYDGSDTVESIIGKAEINKWFPGKLSVTFFFDFPADYQIVDTDYDNYSIVYGCESFLDIRLAEFYWVLVRDQIEEGTSEFNSVMDTAE